MTEIVGWTCPHCGGENEDYDDTLFPICGDCGESVDWDEIDAQQENEPSA